MANILEIIITADDRATQELSKVAEAGRKLSSDYKALGITLTAVGASIIGSMAVMTKKWADAGDQIYELAQKTGFSTEALSELKYAADLSGSSIGGLEISIRRMQVVISDSKNAASASAKALRELGIAYQDLAGLSPEQQFERIAGALADIQNPALKTALAIELFGRSGTDMLPMLAEGSAGLEKMRQEAQSLGVVFSSKAAKAADALKDSITKLKASISGATSTIAQNLAPIIKNLADTISSIIKKVKDWTDAHPDLAKAITNVALGVGIFATVMGTALLIIPKVVTALALLKAAFLGALGPIGWISLAISGLIALGTLLIGNWDKIVGYFKGPAYKATKQLEGAMGDLKESLVPKLDGAIQTITDDYQSLIDLFQSGEYKNVGFLSDAQLAKIRAIDPALADQLKDYQDLSTAQDQLIAGYDAEERAARQAAVTTRLGEIKVALTVPGIKESDKTALINEQTDLNRELAELCKEDYKASYTSLLDQNASVIQTGLQNQIDTIWTPYLDAIKAGFNSIPTFLQTDWAKNMNDAVAAGLLQPDVAKTIIDSINKAIDDYAKGQGAAPEGGPVWSKGNLAHLWDINPTLKKLLGLQSGGIVTQPTLAMVGERGAEAVIPLDQLEGRGGNTVNIQLGVLPGDDVTMNRVARIIKQAIDEDGRRNFFGQVQKGYGWGTSSK